MNILMSLINRLRLVARLMLDRRVPFFLKAIPFAPLAYFIFPIDIVPDMLPLLGQLDDLGIIVLSLETFIFMCPPEVVREHQAQLESGTSGEAGSRWTSSAPYESDRSSADGANVVDGEYRRIK